jgi:class III poly(R)-hydroxyalkanoic acid synthase PhaE subunit
MPAFGFARERQERMQALMQAQVDYQDKSSAYNALMMKSAQRAYEVFEDKLAERAEPGRQLQSARAMFDLWIDAAEEAYAEIALSPEFRKVYGELVDAQMRVRAGMQKEVEQMSEKLGMPTRSEVDSAHRKIAELERQLRRMRDAAQASSPPTPTAKPASRVAEGSLKLAGDPLTGPRRGAAKPQKPASKSAAKPIAGQPTKGKR